MVDFKIMHQAIEAIQVSSTQRVSGNRNDTPMVLDKKNQVADMKNLIKKMDENWWQQM